jgi:putative membrane protein insertion efficiency factor
MNIFRKYVIELLFNLIRLYQLFISPFLGNNCRFYLSCSAYAKEAIMLHGLRFGLYLSILRILRCNPFCKGGDDPVPQKLKNKDLMM